MIRLVVDAALDAIGAQCLPHAIALAVGNPDRKDMRNHAAVIEMKRADPRRSREEFLVTPRQRNALRGKLRIQPLQLGAADRRKQVAHVVAPALLGDVKLTTALALIALVGVLLDAQ